MKLMLVDDHALFMEGLQYLLETHGIGIAGTASNGEEAVRLARRLRPDIILMDIRMPKCSGIDALKQIKAEMPEIKVVMLTTSDEDEDLFEAVKCGASGYLLKDISAEKLFEMLSDMQNGGVPLSSGLAARLLKEFGQNGSKNGAAYHNKTQGRNTLTERQTQILKMVAKEIGKSLGLTERTVKYHMGRIIELLHMENRAQVIAYAAQNGFSASR